MEEENLFKSKKEGSYITGIIGAIIGGLIASIPWVVMYVKGGMILSLLAIIIALGTLKGYQIFKGKIKKPMIAIVVVVSLLVIIFSTAFVIPFWISKENNVELSYIYEKSKDALIHDLFFSIMFGILGIGASISSINKVLDENDEDLSNEKNEIMQKSEEIQNLKVKSKLKEKDKEILENIRSIFEKYNAFDKHSGIMKEQILEELKCENPEKVFKKYKNLEIIKKYKGKYYYRKGNELTLTKGYWVWFIIFIIIIVVPIVLNTTDDSSKNNNTNTINDSTIENLEKVSLYNFLDTNISFLKNSEFLEFEDAVGNFGTRNGNAEIFFQIVNKQDIENMDIVSIKDSEEEYIYSIYPEVEQKNSMEEVKFEYANGYKLSFETVYNERNIKINDYILETENYYISVTTYSLKSVAEKYDTIFENMVNTLKENN